MKFSFKYGVTKAAIKFGEKYTRIRYLWFTNAYDTYASTEFIERLVKVFPFKIEKVQTDNGFEFTNRLSWQAFVKDKKTMFEEKLEKYGIEHKCIKPHIPKQNGKTERSHRKDQERTFKKNYLNNLIDNGRLQMTILDNIKNTN